MVVSRAVVLVGRGGGEDGIQVERFDAQFDQIIEAVDDALQVAAIAGLSAVVNAVTQLARWRLSVLPSPGEGLIRPPGDLLDVPGEGGVAG